MHWTDHTKTDTFKYGFQGHYITYADYILKCIFLNAIVRIFMKVLYKLVPNGPIKSRAALVQIMAKQLTSDKPLSEPLLVCFAEIYMSDTWQWCDKAFCQSFYKYMHK